MSEWKTVPGLEIQWREWDDEHVLFDKGSGDTHVLNPVGAAVLKRLITQPYLVSGLAAAVADDLDYEVDDTLSDYIEEVIAELSYLHLIEQVAA